MSAFHVSLVPRARLELARLSTLDPKSSASANFATSAKSYYEFIEIKPRCPI